MPKTGMQRLDSSHYWVTIKRKSMNVFKKYGKIFLFYVEPNKVTFFLM